LIPYKMMNAAVTVAVLGMRARISGVEMALPRSAGAGASENRLPTVGVLP